MRCSAVRWAAIAVGALRACAEEILPDAPEVLCADGTMVWGTAKVTETPWGVKGIASVDLDQDGDLDILTAAYTDDEIAWCENDGNQGFTDNLVDGNADGAYLSLIHISEPTRPY